MGLDCDPDNCLRQRSSRCWRGQGDVRKLRLGKSRFFGGHLDPRQRETAGDSAWMLGALSATVVLAFGLPVVIDCVRTGLVESLSTAVLASS